MCFCLQNFTDVVIFLKLLTHFNYLPFSGVKSWSVGKEGSVKSVTKEIIGKVKLTNHIVFVFPDHCTFKFF